jgi:hypothetical protein
MSHPGRGLTNEPEPTVEPTSVSASTAGSRTLRFRELSRSERDT